MAKHSVVVHGTSCEVSTHQQSKTVWIARGTYMQEWFEGKGRTENAALKSGHEQARYFGYDPWPRNKP
jgi:hypothetical protein